MFLGSSLPSLRILRKGCALQQQPYSHFRVLMTWPCIVHCLITPPPKKKKTPFLHLYISLPLIFFAYSSTFYSLRLSPLSLFLPPLSLPSSPSLSLPSSHLSLPPLSVSLNPLRTKEQGIFFHSASRGKYILTHYDQILHLSVIDKPDRLPDFLNRCC